MTTMTVSHRFFRLFLATFLDLGSRRRRRNSSGGQGGRRDSPHCVGGGGGGTTLRIPGRRSSGGVIHKQHQPENPVDHPHHYYGARCHFEMPEWQEEVD